MLASEFLAKIIDAIDKHGDHPIIVRGEDGELNNNEPAIFFEEDIFESSSDYGKDEQLHYLDGFVIG